MSNKAIIVPAPQTPFKLETLSIPTPGPSQLVIRNHALALNPIDHKLCDLPKQFSKSLGYNFPQPLGFDAAGTVHAVGPNVSRFAPGDRVLFYAEPTKPGQAAYQQYVVADTHLTAKIPARVSFQEAATLPVSVATAAGLLYDAGVPPTAKAAPGLAIFVNSGASSVGTGTIQLAHAIGATVLTTASPKHHAYLRELGADEVFDYRSATLAQDLRSAAEARGVTITKFIDASSADLPAIAKVVSELGGGDFFTVTPFELMFPGQTPPENVKPIMSGSRVVAPSVDRSSAVFHGLVETMLESGALRPARVQIVPGGLAGIEEGLKTLRKGVSGVKLVVEIEQDV